MMNRSCAVLTAMLVASVLSSPSGYGQDAAPRRIAFLVGINAYQKPGFRDLQYAERDVAHVQQELKSLGFAVTLLTGKAATREAIDSAVTKLVAPLSKEDVMLVMLCGHGQQVDVKTPDGKTKNDAFFCPYDAIRDKPETLFSLSYLTDDVLGPNVGTKLLLVDACRDDPDPGRGRGVEGKVIALPEDTAVMFSCRKGQQSFENDNLQHGLFTYCVLEALRGEGARGGEIAWSNVQAHVNYRMASQEFQQYLPTGRKQQPIPAGGVPYTVLGRLADNREVTNSIGMKLVLIPAGEFLMGSPDSEAERSPFEDSQHRARITKPFYMGAYEVTQQEWRNVMGTNPSAFASTGGRKDSVAGIDTSRFPVDCVSWYDAVEFCNKLSARESLAAYYRIMGIERTDGSINSADVSVAGGKGYRLPTEAEWEYACRAGTTTPFHFGTANNGREANVNGDYHLERPMTVGSYAPNTFGLYDMHGNVWEWCFDLFDETDYRRRNGLTPDPIVTNSAENRYVVRGGSWNTNSRASRSSARIMFTPDFRNFSSGFRLSRTP